MAPHEDMHQGRHARNRVPRVSIYAGTPDDDYERTPEDDLYRARFWRLVIITVALFAGLLAVALLPIGGPHG